MTSLETSILTLATMRIEDNGSFSNPSKKNIFRLRRDLDDNV